MPSQRHDAQKPAFKVGAGDALELTVPDAEETPVEKEDIPLEILL